MKLFGKTKALAKLKTLKDVYQKFLKETYENKAKDCLTCEEKGVCCADAHFVNVHITRLEAVAIKNFIEKLNPEKQSEIYERNQKTIEKYNLSSDGDTFKQKFACPLFEKETGCLIHKEGKPIPCIQHACYENKDDLPPDKLQTKQEKAVERLNQRAFGNAWNWHPLPIWLDKISKL